MGHLGIKQLWKDLQYRLDMNPIGAPESKHLYEILKILYSEPEAKIAASMPLRLSSASRIARCVGMRPAEVQPILDQMVDKNLVIDFVREGRNPLYFLCPTIVGLFEFSMMRIRTDIDQKKLAKALHTYILDDPIADFPNEVSQGETSPFRVMPNETALTPDAYTEVLDFEKATQVIETATAWSTGLCHCRHVKAHIGKACRFPMDNCTTLNWGADYFIGHQVTKAISKTECLERLYEAREFGMVQLADNIKEQVTFLCHCCKCCCGALEGFRRLKENLPTRTANYQIQIDESQCSGCGKCVKLCPIEIITLETAGGTAAFPKRKKQAQVDRRYCLGCGVCARDCKTGAIRLKRTAYRLIPPEDSYQRVVIMALERGKLPNLIFDEPQNITHQVLRGFLKALLNLGPSQAILASAQLKSKFVDFLLKKVAQKG